MACCTQSIRGVTHDSCLFPLCVHVRVRVCVCVHVCVRVGVCVYVGGPV